MNRSELQAIQRHLEVWRARLDKAPTRNKANELENADITLYSLTFNAYLKAREGSGSRKTESAPLDGFEYVPGKGYLFRD